MTPDPVELRLRQLVVIGRLDGEGHVARRAPLPYIVDVEVEFEQIASRQRLAGVVFGGHLGYVDALFVHLDVLGHEILSHVLAVEYQLGELAARRPVERCLRGQIVGRLVAQQRAVHVVGQQAPAFVLGHAEHLSLGVELDVVGLLGPLPCRVAAPADRRGRSLNVVEAPCAVDAYRGTLDPLIFG